ncbi:unnamed protein product [Vitrella brassicaformis CCMP3155]|uniref:Uncharacterized protein n=3 Tax=Vitrella brassicaformis TaxID=1169539 RepID=A0A0G4GPG5_VITBC|nr:unnamed protein product [Vitrella brassicaformis CCMP3155]|eukprot:CEM32251.1 unnamed protein product [Vitrella brassicaformis CCMP3155]
MANRNPGFGPAIRRRSSLGARGITQGISFFVSRLVPSSNLSLLYCSLLFVLLGTSMAIQARGIAAVVTVPSPIVAFTCGLLVLTLLLWPPGRMSGLPCCVLSWCGYVKLLGTMALLTVGCAMRLIKRSNQACGVSWPPPAWTVENMRETLRGWDVAAYTFYVRDIILWTLISSESGLGTAALLFQEAENTPKQRLELSSLATLSSWLFLPVPVCLLALASLMDEGCDKGKVAHAGENGAIFLSDVLESSLTSRHSGLVRAWVGAMALTSFLTTALVMRHFQTSPGGFSATVVLALVPLIGVAFSEEDLMLFHKLLAIPLLCLTVLTMLIWSKRIRENLEWDCQPKDLPAINLIECDGNVKSLVAPRIPSPRMEHPFYPHTAEAPAAPSTPSSSDEAGSASEDEPSVVKDASLDTTRQRAVLFLPLGANKETALTLPTADVSPQERESNPVEARVSPFLPSLSLPLMGPPGNGETSSESAAAAAGAPPPSLLAPRIALSGTFATLADVPTDSPTLRRTLSHPLSALNDEEGSPSMRRRHPAAANARAARLRLPTTHLSVQLFQDKYASAMLKKRIASGMDEKRPQSAEQRQEGEMGAGMPPAASAKRRPVRTRTAPARSPVGFLARMLTNDADET